MVTFITFALFVLWAAFTIKFTMESAEGFTFSGLFHRATLLLVWAVVFFGYCTASLLCQIKILEFDREVKADLKDLMLDIESRVEG